MRRSAVRLAAGTALLVALAGCGSEGSGSSGSTSGLPFTNSSKGQRAGYDGTWKPVFTDDFSGDQLDPAKWRTREQPPTGRRQCAMPDDRVVQVRDGQAVLGIRRVKPPSKKCPHGFFLNSMIGTGGETDPGFKATYGMFAARLKLQSGRGQHSSFWLQGSGEKSAEIDTVEYYGDGRPDGGVTTLIHRTDADGELHTVGGPRPEVPKLLGDGETPSNGWHVWSVEWSPKGYVFRLDDHVTLRTTKNVSTTEQYMVLSLLTSDWELPALTSTTSTMKVDWVRAWQRSATSDE